MTQTGSDTSSSTKRASILIGCGDQTYGLVSLAVDGTLMIDGNSARITRLLANLRRHSTYRTMTNEQFLVALPEAGVDAHMWAATTKFVGPATGRAAFELGME
jgi:hypothetical protein